MSAGLLLQAVGLGLSLASVILLWLGQAFRPQAVAMEGLGVFSRHPAAIVREVSAGLTPRAATGRLALSLSLQLLALSLAPASADAPSKATVVGVVVGSAAITLLAWATSRELILAQRLVRVAEHPPTDEVAPLVFLFELDLERRGRSSAELLEIPDDLRAVLSRRYRWAAGFAALGGQDDEPRMTGLARSSDEQAPIS